MAARDEWSIKIKQLDKEQKSKRQAKLINVKTSNVAIVSATNHKSELIEAINNIQSQCNCIYLENCVVKIASTPPNKRSEFTFA